MAEIPIFMTQHTRTGIVVLLVTLIVIVFVLVRLHSQTLVHPAEQPVNVVSYLCGGGEAVTAAYYAGKSTPAASPDQPPVPGGRIVLTLADGSVLTLRQTISADGGRYVNADESVVFWDKGNGAMFAKEGAQTQEQCVLIAADPGGLPNVYATSTAGFSIRYPAGFAVDDAYVYQALGLGKEIAGVKFTIPETVATGTNLGTDSYVSVEHLSQAPSCTANLFLESAATSSEVIDGDMTYSLASSTGAGAGNRYEETVYALPGINSCTAVHYFVHYGVFENYPPGMVKMFDRDSLIAQFGAIRRTLKVAP